ncbi:unnamed protein product, partial [marine sediment metagenome]
ILQRLTQSENQDDESYQQLIEFLGDHIPDVPNRASTKNRD